MTFKPAHSCCGGFSLMELIVVIVLVGILSQGAGLLIATPINSYQDQLRRTKLVDRAEMAMRQIARDTRKALPNSIRMQALSSGWALELAPSIDGARYRDEPGDIFISDLDQLDFILADSSFNLLGNFENLGNTTLPNSYRLVVYNTNPEIFYTDAFSGSNTGRVTPAGTSISLSSASSEQRVTLNPAFLFSRKSPTQRLFVVDTPISYICDKTVGQITRYSGYAFQVTQPLAIDFSSLNNSAGIVTDQVEDCSLSYQPGSSQRGGTLTFSVTLEEANERVSLLYQVHVENAP